VYNNLNGTNGWNDRQLVQTAPSKLYAKALSTIARLAGGFGAYIWLNLHIGETQYMFSHLFKNDDQLKIQVGDKYSSSSLNTYNQTTAVFGQSSTIQILTVKTIDAVQFVTSMTIDVGGVTYIIDTTPFGDTISIDFTGNGHWSGSALLYLATDLKTSVGTAFVEQNNMQPLKEYSNTIVAQAGLPASDNDLFYNWQPINVETVPSVFLILLMVLFGIGIILGFCWSIPAYVARRKQMKMGKSKSKSESK